MKAEKDGLPDILLEQYALGELSGSEKERVEARLAADRGLRDKLEALGRSNEEILAEYAPAEIAASIRRRMLVSGDKEKRRFLPSRALAFPAAAAVLVLVGAFTARGLFLPERGPARGEVILAKGGAPGLFVYKKSASGSVELADGATAAAGDLLQLKYAAGSARYGAIVSIDGRGSVTWHLPEARGAVPAANLAPRIEEAGAALGSAYELDDAPAFERFFMLSSKEDFDLALVSSALQDLFRGKNPERDSLRLPAGLEYKSILLKKAGGAP